MTRLFWLAAAAFATGAVAQSTETITITIVASNDGGSSQTMQMNPPAMQAGAVHQVTVGGDAGLVYTPPTISAAVGDMVQFNFMSANHTVTQSSFTTPCVKMAGGADSGFMANPNNTVNPPPMMMFQVMTTDPIWMYCRQKGHCGKGMAFSINPTAAKSQDAFVSAAIAQNGTATAASNSTSSSSSSGSATSSASSSASTTSSSSTGVVSGTSSNANGQCSCSCLCGQAAFPDASQGIGLMGGMSGSIPASAAANMAKRAAIPLLS